MQTQDNKIYNIVLVVFVHFNPKIFAFVNARLTVIPSFSF